MQRSLKNPVLDKFKTQYQQIQQDLNDEFNQQVSVVQLMSKRGQQIDKLLKEVWQYFSLDNALCLVAAGGYGREELCLYSDIDLLILIPDDSHQQHQQSIANFLTMLWDIGLEVGHSVRDIKDCKQVIGDLTILTNLLESRYLFGEQDLFTQMQDSLKSSSWTSQSFLLGRQKEWRNRYHRYQDTAYELEPNIKESPGGLRDIQTLLWVTKWHFNIADLSDLLANGFLKKSEYDILDKQQKVLWHLRFGLHALTHKRTDKIGFSEQKKLAKLLGFIDKDTMAVEQLMKTYYKAVADINRISDILMQSLENLILHTQAIDKYFSIKSGYLCANMPQVFTQDTTNLLHLFAHCAYHPYIQGIHTEVLRELLDNLDSINENFIFIRKHAEIFLSILKAKQGVNFALNLMSRYGVLARIIPAFGQITGLMQYDLFHKFTVDQHTLFVVRNLRRFFIEQHKDEFFLCYQVANKLEKPELLILAGLFHDIAKGRGGDHANLGAIEANNFCHKIGLNSYDSALVAWLVEQHLLMSSVAQKQDLTDPEVIINFSNIIGSQQRLNYLYLLTVADIRATNKELWNDWKDALLRQLYHSSHDLLRHGLAHSKTQYEIIEQTKSTVLSKLQRLGYEQDCILAFYETLVPEYFVRYSPDEISSQYDLIHKRSHDGKVIGFLTTQMGKLDIFIYTDDKPCVFLTIVLTLEKLSLSILDAKIISSQQGKTFNTISIEHQDFLDLDKLKKQLEFDLLQENKDSVHKTHKSKKHQHFSDKTLVDMSQDSHKFWTILEIQTLDKSGVLSSIVAILCQQNYFVINARVATFGERVEDIFLITNQNKRALTKIQTKQLKQQLLNIL